MKEIIKPTWEEIKLKTHQKVLRQRNEVYEKKRTEKIEELKRECNKGETCYQCNSIKNLITCIRIDTYCRIGNFINYVDLLPRTFICKDCLNRWITNFFLICEKELTSCHTFKPIPEKEMYYFKDRGGWSIFLKKEILEDEFNLVHKLKYMKEKLHYVHGKNYDINFFKPSTRSYYNSKEGKKQHLDKYGNEVK